MAPARRGPATGCQPPAASAGDSVGAREAAIHAGWRPVHSSHSPSTSAAACTIAHTGRSAGAIALHCAIAPTLDAATAPPAA